MTRLGQDDTWITVGEMADRLRVHKNTARNYADAGKAVIGDVEFPLRSYRLPGKPGHRRISASDVEALRQAMLGDDATS